MTFETILRRVVLTGLFALPFIPFIIFSDFFFPFITGKNFVFRILIETLFAIWVVLAYLNAAYRPKKSLIFWAVGFFIAIIFFADLFGANPYKSFWSNYERMEGFVALAHLFFYFIIASSLLSSEKLWERFWQTNIFASVLMSFYGMFQLSGILTINQGGARLDGTFGNSAYLAVYMLLSFFLTAFLLARHKGNYVLKWAYCAIMALQVAMLYFTETRGTIIGLFVGIFIASLLTAIFERRNIVIRHIALGSILGVIIFVGGFIAIKNTSFVQRHETLARLASISISENTTKSRFMVWNMALDGWKEHPILGWGQENFNFVFNKYYNPGMYAQEQWFDRAHNIFFDWLIAGGILGLLSYLALFLFALWFIWKSTENTARMPLGTRIKHWFVHLGQNDSYLMGFSVLEKSILTGLLAAYFIHNFFVFDNLWSYVLFLSLLAYLHHYASIQNQSMINNHIGSADVRREGAPAFAAIVSLVLIGAIYIVNVRPILANIAIIDGFKQAKEGPIKNLEAFERAIGWHTFGTGEAREQLVQTAIRMKEMNVPQEIMQKFFDTARRETVLQNEEFPGDARNESFAALLLSRFGMHDEALEHIKKAHDLSPNKQAVYFDMVNVYLGKRDTIEALALAKKAYDLEPHFEQAAKVYILAAIYAGDEKLAQEISQKSFGSSDLTDDDFINAYGNTGKFDKAVILLEKRILKNPEDAENHIRLSAGYLQLGRKKDAIEQIRKAIEIKPELKEQGEEFIKQINHKK